MTMRPIRIPGKMKWYCKVHGWQNVNEYYSNKRCKACLNDLYISEYGKSKVDMRKSGP